MQLAVVVTTISAPTPAMVRWADRVSAIEGATIVVVGDAKGPWSYDLPSLVFLSLKDQSLMGLSLEALLPKNHYARKNLGYLHAIAMGAQCIYETDDDNAPKSTWAPRDRRVDAVTCSAGARWVNVYRQFSREFIWPRGLPLSQVRQADPGTQSPEMVSVETPIQQGLADGSPDVDAVWRMLFDKPVWFGSSPSLLLSRGQWCPFNSQSTWWWPDVFPLLYLPSHCSFRMTDIWRSFVAQRCLWEMSHGVVFHSSEVEQDRNAHVPLRDLRDEVPGYLLNDAIVECLQGLQLDKPRGSCARNLVACYSALVNAGYIDRAELGLVNAFLSDLESVWNARQDVSDHCRRSDGA